MLSAECGASSDAESVDSVQNIFPGSRGKPKRTNHNELERKRRLNQRKKLEQLRDCIPNLRAGDKPSTVTIIEKAKEHMDVLNHRIEVLELDIERARNGQIMKPYPVIAHGADPLIERLQRENMELRMHVHLLQQQLLVATGSHPASATQQSHNPVALYSPNPSMMNVFGQAAACVPGIETQQSPFWANPPIANSQSRGLDTSVHPEGMPPMNHSAESYTTMLSNRLAGPPHYRIHSEQSPIQYFPGAAGLMPDESMSHFTPLISHTSLTQENVYQGQSYDSRITQATGELRVFSDVQVKEEPDLWPDISISSSVPATALSSAVSSPSKKRKHSSSLDLTAESAESQTTAATPPIDLDPPSALEPYVQHFTAHDTMRHDLIQSPSEVASDRLHTLICDSCHMTFPATPPANPHRDSHGYLCANCILKL